jgi:uncharacterized protein YcbK (DUF882 family)
MGNRVTRVIAAAVLGGTVSKIGGGKFANGAVTGAFVQAFNHDGHKGTTKEKSEPLTKEESELLQRNVNGLDKLDSLTPEMRAKAERMLVDLAGKGRQMRIVFGPRDQATNDELVRQGLASPNSKHLSGEALDVIDRSVGYENSQFSKDPSHISWNNAIHNAASSNGLKWGGDFVRQNPVTGRWQGRWDPNHVEMP